MTKKRNNDIYLNCFLILLLLLNIFSTRILLESMNGLKIVWEKVWLSALLNSTKIYLIFVLLGAVTITKSKRKDYILVVGLLYLISIYIMLRCYLADFFVVEQVIIGIFVISLFMKMIKDRKNIALQRRKI